MKKYFLLNDRNDVSKGYTEVSESEIRKYVSEFSDGKPYFINLGYAVMETTQEHYDNFYYEKNRQKYLHRLAVENGETSYDMLDTPELNGADTIEDFSEQIEDIVTKTIMIEKLHYLYAKLSFDERKIFHAFFTFNFSERDASFKLGIPRNTLVYRKEKLLKKLKKLLEN